MTAKEYLGQAYRLDQRINSKLQQVESLRSLTRKVTASYDGETVFHTRNGIHRSSGAKSQRLSVSDRSFISEFHLLSLRVAMVALRCSFQSYSVRSMRLYIARLVCSANVRNASHASV